MLVKFASFHRQGTFVCVRGGWVGEVQFASFSLSMCCVLAGAAALRVGYFAGTSPLPSLLRNQKECAMGGDVATPCVVARGVGVVHLLVMYSASRRNRLHQSPASSQLAAISLSGKQGEGRQEGTKPISCRLPTPWRSNGGYSGFSVRGLFSSVWYREDKEGIGRT